MLALDSLGCCDDRVFDADVEVQQLYCPRETAGLQVLERGLALFDGARAEEDVRRAVFEELVGYFEADAAVCCG